MQIIDFFRTDGFSLAELTDAINVIPNQYGMLGDMGLFAPEGVTQRTVIVEYDKLTNGLLVSKPWGAPGDANKTGGRLAKNFAIPHFPLDDRIAPEDLQGRRAFGSVGPEDAAYVLNKKLTEIRTKHDQTLEWMRLGVLKGSITDGAGNVILAPYTDFGLTQTSVGFALPTAGTEVTTKCLAVKRAIETAMTGTAFGGQIVGIVGPNFYDALTTHPNVKAAFANWNALQNNYSDYRTAFQFGNIRFVEYNGSVPDSSGSSQALVGTDDAYFFPLGTNLFKTNFAPADFMETVNTMGMPFYMKTELMEFGRGVKIHTQANPLPLCLKPGVIVKGTKV
jgi:hypothetical protein